MKIGRWLLIIFGVLIIIGVVGYIYLDELAEDYAKTSLDEILKNDPDPLYDYSYGDLKINLAKGDLTIIDIVISPKRAALDSLHSGGLKVLVEASIDKITIAGFEIMEFFNEGTLDINKILVLDPKVNYLVNSSVKKVGNSLVINDILSDDLRTATVGQILIDNASIEWSDVQDLAPKLMMDSVYVEFDSIYVDSVTLLEPFAFKFSEARFEARLYDQELSELYRAKAEKIYLDYQKNILIIQGPELVPTKGKYNYGEVTKTETDLFSMKGKSIEIEGFVSGSFAEKGLLIIPKIHLNGIDLDIFRDKHLPDPPFKKIPLPATLINGIPLPILVDSIFLNNCSVSSAQLDTLNDKAGTVFFKEMNGVITNLTNDSVFIVQNNIMEVNTTALFMDKGSMNAHMSFILDSPYDQFHMTARLGQMDAKTISPVLDSLLLIRITSGKIHSLSMDINGNDDHAVGTMDFRYENLKIDILSLKHERQSNWLLKTIANTVIRSSNISGQKNFKIGSIETDRRKDRAIFNFLWKATKSGLLSTSTPIKGAKKSNKSKKKK